MADPRIFATVRKPVKQAIKKLARKEGRSESEMVGVMLEAELERRGLLGDNTVRLAFTDTPTPRMPHPSDD